LPPCRGAQHEPPARGREGPIHFRLGTLAPKPRTGLTAKSGNERALPHCFSDRPPGRRAASPRGPARDHHPCPGAAQAGLWIGVQRLRRLLPVRALPGRHAGQPPHSRSLCRVALARSHGTLSLRPDRRTGAKRQQRFGGLAGQRRKGARTALDRRGPGVRLDGRDRTQPRLTRQQAPAPAPVMALAAATTGTWPTRTRAPGARPVRPRAAPA